MSYAIDLGPWGVELDDSAFGRALAALGVALGVASPSSSIENALGTGADASALRAMLARGGPARWDIARIVGTGPEALARMASGHPAAAFASAWGEVVGVPETADLPRLAIERFTDEIGPYYWLADQLAQPRVYASASVVARELESDHNWHWPLRIGFLDDPATASFRSRLRPEGWSMPLVRFTAIEETGAADLLVVPQALPDALARLASVRGPLDLGAILCLGGLAGRSDMSVSGVIGVTRLAGRGWGVAIADVPADAGDAWLSSLLEELSHDVTLEVALHASLVGRGRGVLFAEPDALAASTVRQAATRLAAAVRGLRPSREVGAEPTAAAPPEPATDTEPPTPEPEPERTAAEPPEPTAAEPPEPTAAEPPTPLPGLESFGLPPQISTDELVAAATDPSNFRRMRGGASATAALEHRMHARRRAAPQRAEARFIQVEILEGPAYAGPPRRTILAAEAAHAIDVWVGPPTGAIHGRAPLPEKDLPKDRPVTLTVVFAELDGDRRTQTGTLDLPPTGAARPHRFFFVPAPRDVFRARIIISYRNRILQTALLTAPVVAADQASAPTATIGRRIRLETEAVVRPGLADLKGRRPFSVALVHNHDGAGSPGGTVLGGGRAVPLQLGDIGRTVEGITAMLSEAAADAASYGPTLEAEATVALLFRLARQGVLLRDDLLGRRGVADLLAGAERIQVLSASANDILPLEFAYDFPTPARPPKLCPNARQALLDGRCDGREHHEDAEGHLDVVCPAGFWAMSRVIERHIADPEGLARDGAGASYGLASEPIRDRDRLPGLTGAVFAASAKVDAAVPGSSALVESALAEVTGGRSTRVRTWSDWVTTVATARPSLLVLLAHSVRDDETAMTALEIETAERRDAADITARYLGIEGEHPAPPVVFLLGCDTAVADLQYQTFVSRFRQVGAAIVVGTISTVAGSHAAGVAASLSRAIKRPDDSKWLTFGDLLRDVRRTLLSDGEVMALCLTAYGDADWRFPGGRSEAGAPEVDT